MVRDSREDGKCHCREEESKEENEKQCLAILRSTQLNLEPQINSDTNL